jgi:hypothetical protein
VGLGQVSSVLGTDTPRTCHRSISIVGDERFGVCDCAHWAFVMKGSGRVPPRLILDSIWELWTVVVTVAAAMVARGRLCWLAGVLAKVVARPQR